MVKKTKRTKKFEVKGGAKGMLKKGTITKKGKVKLKTKSRKLQKDQNSTTTTTTTTTTSAAMMNDSFRTKLNLELEKRNAQNFTSEENLGDLNLDDFLQSVVDDDDDGNEDGDVDEQSKEPDDEELDENDDEDDDDDDDLDSMSDEEGDDSETLQRAEERMKKEMENLAQTDPDFHKYLQDNESSLLDFQNEILNDDDDEEENQDEEEGDDDDNVSIEEKERKTIGSKETKPESKQQNSIVVNAKVLQSFEDAAFEQHGVKALKRIVLAYKSACHMGDAKNANESGEAGSGVGSRKYILESSRVFDRLLVVCLKQCHEEFRYHLLGKGANTLDDLDDDDGENEDSNDSNMKSIDEDVVDVNKPINPRHMAKSNRWGHLKLIITTFFKSTVHLLTEAKECKLLTFILKHLAYYIPFLSAFPRLDKSVLKILISLWSSAKDTSADYQVARLNAFLRIRQLAITQPFPFIELCLKSTYLAYAKSSKFANASTVTSLLPTLTFMGNCVVELYSLDYASSYQHAFVYIRQLALHLRSAIQKKTPEAFRVVYCWQYLHCLKLWSAVLAACCGGKDKNDSDDETLILRSLIYPLVEVIFGVARLIPSTRYLPLRLHCVRFLQQLAAASESFIPTTSILLEALDMKELTMKPKRVKTRGDDIRGIRLAVTLKLPKVDPLRTSEQLDACVGEIFLLLNREADLYRFSPGFPEFSIRICQRLRKFSKETTNSKYRAYAKGCIELCEKFSKEASQTRSVLEQTPRDVKRLEALLPNNIPTMLQRYDATISKERRLETAAAPALSETVKRKTADESVDDDNTGKSKSKGDLSQKGNKKGKGNKQKKNAVVNKDDLENVDALEEDDDVKEGIDWSESEEDDSDMMSESD